ncbi:MAG: glycosyltransferase family 4 protein, partial [Opitutales bacterium]
KFPELEPKVVLAPGAPSRHVIAADTKESREDTKGKLRIITVGRLHPRKGQDRMLAALAALPVELKDSVEYVLIGPETHSRYVCQIREQSEKIGLSVTFSGDLSDDKLREAYADADVFALTSTAQPDSVEGFGFVYLEAASHGLPAIAHRIGGVEDAVVNEETGLLIEHDNPADLSRAIERLLRDSGLRKRLGSAAKERAEKFTWKSTAKALYT